MKIAVIGSLILSILHSILFYEKKPGISMFLFCIACLFFLFYLLEKKERLNNKKAILLSIPILLLSSTYGLFNNETLRVLNGLVILGLTGYMIICLENKKVNLLNTFSKIFNIFIGALEYLGDSCSEIKKVFFIQSSDKKIGRGKKIVKAIFITVPIVLIVLALLISADSIFAEMFNGIIEKLQNIFTTELITSLFFRIVVLIIVFIYIVTILYNLLQQKTSYAELQNKEHKVNKKIDSFTFHCIITVLNIIYLVFCLIQITYLFNAKEMINDFQYADYARQGYFQLIIVSIINLILIVSSNSINNGNKSYTTIMKLALVLFTIIILISSFYRMYLYEQEYGLTFLRIVVFLAIITELMLMIPTVLYILNKNINLFSSYVIIITAMYIVLNFINIDSLIVKRNVELFYEKGEKTEDIDMYYLKHNISIDGIKEMQKLLISKNAEIREEVLTYLQSKQNMLQETKSIWEWNYNREAAKKSLEKLNLDEVI